MESKLEGKMSSFDINILDNVYVSPQIELTFPLPTDQDTYVKLDGNGKLNTSFRLLQNFLSFMVGFDTDKIYENNEYKYSINKYSKEFHQKFEKYMDDKLTRTDDKLNELVYDLVNQELRLKLIKPQEFDQRFTKVKQFMINYYKENNKKNLPTFHSETGIRIAYITVTNLFLKMYPDGIWVNRNDFESLYQQYLKNPMSILFLPNHQSHVDYIIMHVICVRFQMSVPTVIAGENLNVAVFGTLLKNLGAIFIPRSFNNELYTEQNLNNVIEFFLINNVGMEVFIEGTRSRDGKLLLPKYGILKSFVGTYFNQREKENNPDFDLLFQPVSITYERIYEADAFIDEMIGKDKIKESFFGILKSGIDTLRGERETEYTLDKEGFNDNSERDLAGRLYIKLGNRFKLSEFIENDNKDNEEDVNLKKLGFKILHEINNTKFIPNVAVVGTALQIYYYFNFHVGNNQQKDPKYIKIDDFIPTLKLVITILQREIQQDPINSSEFSKLLNYNNQELKKLTIDSIKPFFRYIAINEDTSTIRISNSIELLYYKNLTIHLIIERCLVCAILLLLNKDGKATYNNINKIYYILTGPLKVEFLFDYNYDPRSQESFVLQDLVDLGVILRDENGTYHIEDLDYAVKLSNLITPFLQSYINLIKNLTEYEPPKKIERKVDPKTKKLMPMEEDELKYVTTKTLLKYTIKNSQDQSIESFNKQYLLSDLYYLNHLQLVKIFKNKAKTKAFVKILDNKDLNILRDFLQQVVDKNLVLENDTKLSYLSDIINKNARPEAPKL